MHAGMLRHLQTEATVIMCVVGILTHVHSSLQSGNVSDNNNEFKNVCVGRLVLLYWVL